MFQTTQKGQIYIQNMNISFCKIKNIVIGARGKLLQKGGKGHLKIDE